MFRIRLSKKLKLLLCYICLNFVLLSAVKFAFAANENVVFAGGCFWCMEPPFEKLDGVSSVVSGYIGGHKENPSYSDVSSGVTGHLEAVLITYDPQKIDFIDLLEVFWRQINPTDPDGQFVDRGQQYTTGIFYYTETQKGLSEKSKMDLENSKRFNKPIVTTIKAASAFYTAEDYHQDYYKKNPVRYKYYRYRSGRDQYLDETWGKDRYYKPKSKKGEVKIMKSTNQFTKPSVEELKKKLSPLQFKVTQKDGTEPAFKNEYWDNKKPGIYVDIVSGEPLFSSLDKFDSGTGWPSFTRPIEPSNIVEKPDRKLFVTRTEVRSTHGGSHLGHVFDDGPQPTGKRYCINSAALKFIPLEDLEKEGYGDFKKLFEVRK